MCASGSQRQRAKKITVACNFCRCPSSPSLRSAQFALTPYAFDAARKLKCDGGRPACGQCFKRSHPCDYTANNKRRHTGKPRKQYGSDSEGDSIEDGTAELDHPSRSPELSSSAPHSRRSSNVSMLLTDTLPPLNAAVEPRDSPPAVLPPLASSTGYGVPPPPLHAGSRRPSLHTELPPIATLSASAGMQDDSGPLPPLIHSSHVHGGEPAVSRRRTSSAASGSVTSGRGGRGGGGSKIVACNFCRGASQIPRVRDADGGAVR